MQNEKPVLKLSEVFREDVHQAGERGACGDTYEQLVEKYGEVIDMENGGGCAHCMQILCCSAVDYKKMPRPLPPSAETIAFIDEFLGSPSRRSGKGFSYI